MASISQEPSVDWVTGLSIFFDSNAIWFLPITIIAYQFMLKVAIGDVSTREQWQSVLQLPTDLSILAITFLASIILIKPENAAGIAASIFVCIIGVTLNFLIFKKSPIDFSKNSLKKAVPFLIINLVISFLLLAYSASKLLGV